MIIYVSLSRLSSKRGWVRALGAVQHGMQVCLFGVQLVQKSSPNVLTMGAIRPSHRCLAL